MSEAENNKNGWITPAKAAEIVGVSAWTVRRWGGEVEGFMKKVGGRYYVREDFAKQIAEGVELDQLTAQSDLKDVG